MEERLRFSVQTLDGHIYDDDDEQEGYEDDDTTSSSSSSMSPTSCADSLSSEENPSESEIFGDCIERAGNPGGNVSNGVSPNDVGLYGHGNTSSRRIEAIFSGIGRTTGNLGGSRGVVQAGRRRAEKDGQQQRAEYRSDLGDSRRQSKRHGERESDEEEGYWDRKSELQSVLRRLRCALRRVDGALAAAQVSAVSTSLPFPQSHREIFMYVL